MNTNSLFSVHSSAVRMALFFRALSPTAAAALLFLFGIALLAVGLQDISWAQHNTEYNDERLSDALNVLFIYIEGTFGAMVMVAGGIGAIMSSAFGQYRAALSLLVVAVGAFVLRSLVGTFFNDDTIQA